MQIDREALRSRLVAELAAIDNQFAQAGEAGQGVELDKSSDGYLERMDAKQQQVMAKNVQAQLLLRKRKLNAAQTRLDAGNYGLCCECKDELAAERLDADPATVFCPECAEERENS